MQFVFTTLCLARDSVERHLFLLAEQPIGWNPDLNDGVRMNIRPFVEAGILARRQTSSGGKDRGSEPKCDAADYPWFWRGERFVGDRVNDVHLTTGEKLAARKAKQAGRKDSRRTHRMGRMSAARNRSEGSEFGSGSDGPSCYSFVRGADGTCCG